MEMQALNFLGHAFFTDGDDALLAGNLFGDFVKGNIKSHPYPDNIKKGLVLHRKLDTLCDQQPSFRDMKNLLDKKYNHFKGVLTDIFIDHLLAKYWADFSSTSLESFAAETYRSVGKFRKYFPESFIRVFEFMKRDNWFLSNRELIYIENTLKRMETRLSLSLPLHTAVNSLIIYERDYQDHFKNFMNDMTYHANNSN